MRKETASILIFLILPFFSLFSQSINPRFLPEQEAPTALFQTEIADAEVDLFLLGSWKATLTASLGFAFPDGGEPFSMVYPGMEPGIFFKQVPDLTISLWLMNRYFFETTFLEDYENNTFLLGYQGKEGEVLQSVRLGNTDLGIDDYAFLQVPAAPGNSLGATGKFQTASTQHELLLRYDPVEKRSKTFLGKNEVIEEQIELPGYVRGRFFILPDTEVENCTVYIETEGGAFSGDDGKSYRIAGSEDVIIDEEGGFVTLKEPAPGRVLAYYEKDGKSVGDTSLGQGFLCDVNGGGLLDPSQGTEDFNFFGATYSVNNVSVDAYWDVTLDGTTQSILLHDPQRYTPFELLNRYPTDQVLPEENWRSRITLVSKGNLTGLGDELSGAGEAGEPLIALYGTSGTKREIKNRYPFVGTKPELYGPYRETRESRVEDLLTIRVLVPVEGYSLEPNLIPGSVSVKRNGRKATDFEVNYESGQVSFLGYIHPNDRIEISYQTVGTSKGGDIVFGFGNRFHLSPNLFIDGAAGLRWNILSGTYSTEERQHPGSVLATAALDYSTESLKARLDTGLSISTPDTTGRFRVLGMESQGLKVPISDSSIFPASPSSITGAIFARNVRGKLIYKDYRSYSPLGGATLNAYTWDPPDDQIYPYQTGSRPGPYTALPDTSSIDGEVMVLEYDLDANEWAGAFLPIIPGEEGVDLSGFDSLTFYWKSLDETGMVNRHLHIGAVSEDLDGDGNMDRENSIYSRGFDFNDSANGAVLLVGGGPDLKGNGSLENEDFNDNGILDGDEDDFTVSDAIPVTPEEQWKRVIIDFSEADKEKLISSRGLRLYIEETAGASASGRLIVSGFTFQGSPMVLDETPTGSIEETQDLIVIREISEGFSLNQPPELLTSVYPEVQKNFHPQDTEQQVLEVNWDSSGGTTNTLLLIKGYTSPVPASQYRKLSMYLRVPILSNPGATTMTVSLSGSDGEGINAAFTPPQFDDWRKLTINLDSREVTLGGETLSGSTVTYTGTKGTLSLFSITMDGSNSGTIYIDEVHCEDSLVNLGFGAAGSVEYKRPGKLLYTEGLDVLSDIRIFQEASFSTEDFAAGYLDQGGPLTTRSYTELEGTLLYTRLRMELGILYAEPDLFLSGGHSLTIPAFPFPVTFTDSYSQRDDPGGITMSRSNLIGITIPGGNIVEFTQESSLLTSTLNQAWELKYSTNWEVPFSISLIASLGTANKNWPLLAENYFANWILGYSLFAPVKIDEFRERRGNTIYSFSLTTLPVGASLSFDLGYSVAGEQEREHSSKGAIDVSIPLQFLQETPAAWSLTPGYRRSFSYTRTAEAPGTFGDDFHLLYSGFGVQEYIYNTWPMAELFSQRTEDLFIFSSQGYEAARFTPSFYMDYNRRYGSNLYDLFLPSTVSLTFSRSLERNASSIEDTYRWGTELRTSAVNLFGSQGAYSITPVFDSDEYSTSIGLDVTSTDTFFFKEVELILQHYLAFYKGNTHELSLENRFSQTWASHIYATNRTDIGFLWSIFPENPIVFPIFKKTLDNGYIRNSEYLDWVLEPYTENKDKYGFSLLLRHETGLVFPDIGDMTAHISIGFDRMVEELSILGLQIGISARFQF